MSDVKLSPAQRIARVPSFVKDHAPKKVRIYDNGGTTFDRYTAVFTGAGAGYFYRRMSSDPFHPQGFGISGTGGHAPIDRPKSAHLGRKIAFSKCPPQVRESIMQDYAEIWRLDLPTLRAACGGVQ